MKKRNRRGHGEGTVYFRGEGRWCGQVTLADGSRKTVYAKTQADAVRKMTALRATLDAGLPILRDERLTVGGYLADWLERVKPPRLRERTWRRYGELVAHVTPSLGRIPLTQLTARQVERLYSAKLGEGLSTTTVHHLHAVLHKALRDALRIELVARNVTDLVTAPRMRHHEIKPLDDTQARTLLRAASDGPDRFAALYALAIHTGMRQGELLALHWHDIDLDAEYLEVKGTLHRSVAKTDATTGKTTGELRIGAPKTASSRRRIRLGVAARTALRGHHARQDAERRVLGEGWEDNDLVFCDEIGRLLDPRGVLRHSFYPLLSAAGLPRIRFHDLRHTAATLHLKMGTHPKIVSEMLGHSTIQITLNIYSHVTPDMQHDAVTALDRLLDEASEPNGEGGEKPI